MKAWLALLALLAASPAWAQSKKYPPVPKDPDREAETHSKIWEETLDPGRTPYEQLVREARQLFQAHMQADVLIVLDKLDKAIQLMPKRPEAYAVRGDVDLFLHHWTDCADDYAAAEQYSPPDETGERWHQRLTLGVCQAHAGRLADAERTLARVASAQTPHGEAWLRLGEVRIAMGKLDEAIGALGTALETPDPANPQVALTHYLLALAYDRARLPGEAEQHMATGMLSDRNFGQIDPQMLQPGEYLYVMGLAYRYAQPRPEYALLYFRRFLALAPDSPWRKRAEEHVRELTSIELPQTIERRAGIGTVDLDAARLAIVKAMPGLRACMAKMPPSAVEVVVTRVGPRSPESRDRSTKRLPPPGISLNNKLDFEPRGRDELDALQRCVEPLVERIALPAPKEHDTYYVLAFTIVAP